MRYRYSLLALPALALIYWVCIGYNWDFLGWWGGERITLIQWLGTGGLVGWIALESVHHVTSSRSMRCACGYSLAGLHCPECGRDLGRPSARAPKDD